MPRSSRLFLLFLALFLLTVAACNDEDDCATCPGQGLEPTLANIWPHADDSAWTFEGSYVVYPMFPDGPLATDVRKAIPSLADLHADLQQPPSGEPLLEVPGMYRFALQGQVVTASGASGQRVVETFYYQVPGNDPQQASGGGDRLLDLIARARPDLRPALLDRLDPAAKALDTVAPPLFLGGYAFACEDSGYFGYGDLDLGHSWTYLAGSLEVGTEFTLQLVSAIADDIFLTGRIWSQGDLVVGGRRYENVVECLYLVDMGESELTDENGVVLGVVHPYVYGTTHYVPGLGPVRGRERHWLPTDPQMVDSPLIQAYAMDLVGATTAE